MYVTASRRLGRVALPQRWRVGSVFDSAPRSQAQWAAHPAIRAELQVSGKDDGTFWMSKEDFCERADSIWMCVLPEGLESERASD